MVEKIIINPSNVRGYGNIITPKTASDYDEYKSTVTKTTDTVYGATETVFNMSPVTYNMSFNSASYTTSTGSVTLQVTVLNGMIGVYGETVTVTGGGGGTGTATTNYLGVANITVTGITQSGTLTATSGFSKTTATVTYGQTSYSLAFSQDTYTCDMMDGVTVSCTLKNGNTPVSGATITLSAELWSVTATTNSSGVATKTFDYYDFSLLPVTLIATYSGVTATCTIEDGGF